jgi:glycosyltransferase involved in cell wall biosynthesis
LLGTAILSTPAGGAGECFVDGETGYLLDCAEQPDLGMACEKLATLIDEVKADPTRHERARERARLLFSVDTMIGRFMELCAPAGTADDGRGSDSLLELECGARA